MAKERPKPKLPIQQLVVLSLCRFAEPIALTSVFPYLPEMIESFNVDKKDVSKWAGIASAAFSLSQAVTGVMWGGAADALGRKPIILLGMVCTMTCGLLFGFSRSLAWAITARSLAGASNGNVGIMRTTVAELVPEKELQPRAFSIMPLVWTCGTIFGPALGGALAKPATKYPGIFGDVGFFKTFPFSLPNIVTTALALFGFMVGFLFFHETLASRRDRRDYGLELGGLIIRACSVLMPARFRSHRQYSRISSASTMVNEAHTPAVDSDPKKQPQASYREIFNYQSCLNLLVYALLAMHSIAYDQLLPIFMHYPRQLDRSSNPEVQLPFRFTGGFGINSDRIGLIAVCYGVVGVFIQFVIFPPLAKWMGVLKSFKHVVFIFPAVYVITPFTALLPTMLSQQVGLFFVMIFKAWAVMFAFPCSTILLTNSANSLKVLGTLNGVAVSLSALGRAAGPALGGWMYTLGIDVGYGILPWWILALVATIAALPVWWLVEMDGFGGTAKDGEDGGQEEAVEDDDDSEPTADETTPLNPSAISKTTSHGSVGSRPGIRREMSNPIGINDAVGPGAEEQYNDALGLNRSSEQTKTP